MRVFVTGATGFIGSHLVRRLVADGHEVAVLVRDRGAARRVGDLLHRVGVVEGDLARLGAVGPFFEDFRPEAVVHAAWSGGNTSRAVQDPAQVFVNVPGSLALLELAVRAHVSCWLGFGTTLEYGRFPVPTSETAPCEPTSLYGQAKLATARLTLDVCRVAGVRALWVRPFWMYGPNDDEGRLVPYLVRTLLAGECPRLTAGEQRWDYLYIDDAVEHLVRLLVSETAHGVYNLASGRAVPLREVAETIRDAVDPALPLGLGELPYAPDQIMWLQGDVERLEATTGWRATVPLDEGLARTIHAARRRPERRGSA